MATRPTKRQKKQAFDEFVASRPSVLAEWMRLVEDTGGPTKAELDGSRMSLDSVARWCEHRYADGASLESLVEGVAAYLAKCVQDAVPHAEWVFSEGPDAARYFPVLSGFVTPFPVNRIVANTLGSLLDPPPRSERDPDSLRNVYDAWLSEAVPPSGRRRVEVAPAIEVMELDASDPFDLQVGVEGEFPSDALLDELRSLDGVEDVLHEDRETILIRTRPGARPAGQVREVVQRHLCE